MFSATKNHRMSEDTLETLIKNLAVEGTPPMHITWQGGEPTLMGIDFYKKAAELQERYLTKNYYSNGFQTNGMHLNEAWAHFFKSKDWLVGLSLDGPECIHNTYRIDLGNKPTHHKIEAKAKMLLKNNVKVNAMCCVTNHSVKFPDQLYRYFKNLGLTYMQFIPIVETDKDDATKAASYSVDAIAYGNFLKRIFTLWYRDYIQGKNSTSVSTIEAVFFNYVGLPSSDCVYQKECGNYLVVEHNGNVYSCDFFVAPAWNLGNIKKDSLLKILNSTTQKNFGLVKQQLPEACLLCPFYDKCFGGCPKDRIKDPRDLGSSHFCTSYKMFLSYADPYLKQLTAEWKRAQIRNSTQKGTYYF